MSEQNPIRSLSRGRARGGIEADKIISEKENEPAHMASARP